MNNNNYILARWRDAITDPPDNDRPVPYYEKWTSGFVLLSAWIRDDGVWIDGSDDSKISTKSGDQWLDITTISAVPLAAVQAAILEMRGEPPWGCDTWEHALDILQAHCGIDFAPMEATK